MKKLSRNEWVAVTVSIFIVGFFFIFGSTVLSIFSKNKVALQQTVQVDKQDVAIGTGAIAVPGSRVVVHYVGRFPDGTIFDSSVARNEPFPFILGDERLIQGWNMGIEGMKEGGRRVLVIPPSLGYGAEQNGPIPANSTLIFEVELLRVDVAQ